MTTTYQLQVSTVNTFATTVYDTSGLTSLSPYVDGLTPGTTYYWRVRATIDLVAGMWSSTFSFTLAGTTTPVWKAITSAIETAVGLMNIAAGYNYDYGSLDTYKHISRTYPAVFIKFSEEDGLTGDGTWVDKISTRSLVDFEVILSSTQTSTGIDAAVDKVADDFKRMFHANLATLQAVGMLDYDYIKTTRVYSLNKTYPVTVTNQFAVNWRQSRITPSTT